MYFRTSLQTLPTSLSTPESDGDTVLTPSRDANMVTVHGTPTPLLREWAKANLVHYSWKDTLLSAIDGVSPVTLVSTHGPDTLVLKFVVSRFTLYWAIYEHLETIGCTMDASKCFRQMVDELVLDENALDEQFKWVFGEWSCIRCMYH